MYVRHPHPRPVDSVLRQRHIFNQKVTLIKSKKEQAVRHVGSRAIHPRNVLTLASLVLLLSLLLAACGQSNPSSGPTPSPNALQEAAKVDTLLRDLLISYQTGGMSAARDYARNTGLLDDQDKIRFGLTLTSASAAPAITSQIKQMGGEVYSGADERLGVAVDLQRLTAYFNTTDKRNFFQELASFKEVREVKILLPPALAQAALTTEQSQRGEGAALVGAERWQKAGFTGQGITVGIIDGGFAGYGSYFGTALPSAERVQLQSFLFGGGTGRDNHGVAVAEVVHALAPAASLILTPIEDEIGFTRAVQHLTDRKVQIIQISLGWGGIFPGDGTGKMNEKLNEARRAGIVPIVSSGNYGQAHYLNTFRPDENGFHRFGGDKLNLKLTAEADSSWVSLRWEEPWNAPKTNLDLYILDSNGRALISSRNEQGATSKPPSELAPFRTTPGGIYFIQVKLHNQSQPPAALRFHLFAYNARLEEATDESSLATPGDARGALTVGASNWQDDRLEAYSSRGPTGDGRAKPELLGPSGIYSTVFKQTFAGTSAAAPHVAGSAALVWSAAREMTAEQIITYLTRHALDLGTPGRDAESGWGRVRLGPEEAARLGLVGLLGAVASGPPFQDDFRVATSGLPNNRLGYYGLLPATAGGAVQASGYFVPGPAGQLNWNSYLARSWQEFRAEVEVRPPGAKPGLCYGLIFWQQGPEDYYTWLLADNRYALLRRNGPTWTTLLDWSEIAASALTTNELRLSLEATSGYLRLRLNATLLQNLTLKPDSSLAPPTRLGGKFGFVAGQFAPIQGEATNPPLVSFSNLVITPLSTKG